MGARSSRQEIKRQKSAAQNNVDSEMEGVPFPSLLYQSRLATTTLDRVLNYIWRVLNKQTAYEVTVTHNNINREVLVLRKFKVYNFIKIDELRLNKFYFN